MKKKESGAFDYQKNSTETPIYHAIILPCFNEEASVIQETILNFSKHYKAQQQYLLFLAMEDREEGSGLKAQKLIDQFQSKFKSMTYTSHVLKEG